MRILIILLFISFNAYSQKGENISVELPSDAYYGENNSLKVSQIKGNYLSIKIKIKGVEVETRDVTIHDGVNLLKGNKNTLKDLNGNVIKFIDHTQIFNFFAQFGWEFYESSYTGLLGFFVFKRESEQL